MTIRGNCSKYGFVFNLYQLYAHSEYIPIFEHHGLPFINVAYKWWSNSYAILELSAAVGLGSPFKTLSCLQSFLFKCPDSGFLASGEEESPIQFVLTSIHWLLMDINGQVVVLNGSWLEALVEFYFPDTVMDSRKNIAMLTELLHSYYFFNLMFHWRTSFQLNWWILSRSMLISQPRTDT